DALSGEVMKALSVADDPKVYHSVIDSGNGLLYDFDMTRYYPFLQQAAAAIRRATDRGVIFSENCYYSNMGIPCSYPRLTRADGGVERNFAFAPHGYDLTVDTPLTNEASPHRVDHIFGEHERTQARLGVPVLVGEWGGMVPGGEKYPALEHLIDKFDRNRWSQTYWHWFDGMENSKIMEILSRPYPQAVAGEIKSYGWDRKNRVFTLSYTGSASVKAPTLIWLPRAPKAVYATRKYQLNRTENGLILQVYAGKGESIVKVEW
ncbi:MAG: cellulase family glycosylhydrolase, partial [Clostridia bacterium]|nr:cellulase family glycosylhydrolase [Clostridia bacterium]